MDPTFVPANGRRSKTHIGGSLHAVRSSIASLKGSTCRPTPRSWSRGAAPAEISRCSPAVADCSPSMPTKVRSDLPNRAASPASSAVSCPGRFPSPTNASTSIVMTDVLEHLDDQAGTLSALRERLRPGGWLLMTVPAMSWMWSDHDVTHHHRRRYQAAELRTLRGYLPSTSGLLELLQFSCCSRSSPVRECGSA